jgi:hypothetical protein
MKLNELGIDHGRILMVMYVFPLPQTAKADE